MRNLNTLGSVRACTLLAGTAAALAAIWGLFNPPFAHSSPRGSASVIGTQPTSELSGDVSLIELPLVTVIGARSVAAAAATGDGGDSAYAVQRRSNVNVLESAAD